MLLARRLILQPARTLQFRPVQRRFLQMQPSQLRMRPMPKEEHSAHTISQRLRTLKKIPAELIPLGVVIGVAIFAAFYSMIRKLFTDKQLRLYRSRKGES